MTTHEIIQPQSRGDWLYRRRAGIGGSDAAAVLGLSPWQSALSLYCDKIGINEIEDSEPDWLYWGKVLEPVIAARYTKETKRELHDYGPFHIHRSSQFPWMCCTIDRQIHESEETQRQGKSGPGILSIKNVVGFKKADWADEPPVAYQIQLQHEMIVLGRSWGSFAVLFNGHDFAWFDVERNDRFCAYLIEQERKFWQRIADQDPPPPGNPADASREALIRLYPKETGSSIELPGEFLELADRIEELKRSQKSAKEELDLIENTLKAAIGDNTFGVLPNGITFSLKTQKRAGYTVAPCEYRALRRMK